jgi:hypothetical protein
MGMMRSLYLIFGFPNTLKYGTFVFPLNEIISEVHSLVSGINTNSCAVNLW